MPIQTLITDHLVVILLVLSLLELLALVLIGYLFVRSNRQKRQIAALLGSKSGVGWEDMIENLAAESTKAGQERAELQQQLQRLGDELAFAVQRIGFVRYNAFPGVGGEMSFSIALLDGRQNGFVVTSIFGREEARVYAKLVKDGQSQIVLSEEEQSAIRQAEHSSIIR